MSTRQIQASASSLRGNEKKYLNDCIDSNWVTQGKYVKRFEAGLQSLTGAKHVIACGSGTAALHLALLALDVRPGQSVIVPAMTYIATANAAHYCGAAVMFCDIDPLTWTMTRANLQKVLDSSAAGLIDPVIIPVHLFDSLAPVDDLAGLGMKMVEDAAHVTGAQDVGNRSVAAAYSFYGSKIIACGEGGAVTTDDDDFAARVRLYRGQGAPVPGRYYHSVIGYNYRMTDMQAAVGCAQLERYVEMVQRRQSIRELYSRHLRDLPIEFQQNENAHRFWAMPILLPRECNRDNLAMSLAERGIQTRPFFAPLPYLPPYRDSFSTPIPVASDLARRGLILPLHSDMTATDVAYVADELKALLEQVPYV